eukprot:CAMPEP_0201865584 /NCGR_PEP_ID=MMETSP0902-20130614/419_1 /ASSEMBLY_ACC=CAM_ASM_000551 /TAXON_ID=420261 /ORGANISM="Thalassiosira antarctica, Strain CCMP982" /LENGTH=92 /DNA_ID=CAMNT_0048390367 /DNA_START=561 /DNA_END=839 /DNA_ORIENTATION=-
MAKCDIFFYKFLADGVHLALLMNGGGAWRLHRRVGARVAAVDGSGVKGCLMLCQRGGTRRRRRGKSGSFMESACGNDEISKKGLHDDGFEVT